MPDFWQFPTVSMGLGPMMAIYQARFMRYMENRGMVPAVRPQGLGVPRRRRDGRARVAWARSRMPVREKLDNLVFVVNCNLQRLDGPVRGNGKIIQELEAAFLGAGWNVIKVVWGSRWDPLLARDTQGLLRRVMEECVDGEYQNFKAKGGAYTREHFFGKYPELKEMVANMSDDDIWRLNRGGHDARKVYAAYAAAMNHKGQPTVILAKTVKGFGLGKAAEGQMVAHQQKKLDEEALRAFRDRFNIPLTDEDSRASCAFTKPADDSAGDEIPARAAPGARRLSARAQASCAKPLAIPELTRSAPCSKARATARSRTTMAFVRILTMLLKDKNIGKNIVPIVPDEARTFGMEGLFRQIGIYSLRGPALHAAGFRPAHVLPRGQEGPDARRGHQRGGLHLLVDRGRHGLREPRHPHGAVLHLLLDVRLPARRRLLSGPRATCAGARLPVRRHRRPHHARGRRPAAPGRPQPAASPPPCRTAWPTTRPMRTSSP